MTTETETNRGRFFVASLLPWLAGGGMLVVYLLTLNHSTSSASIIRISELKGSFMGPRLFAPVTFLLTYPIRWLPAASIGMGLNLFTVVCAALTLALLARSVALLPHDRTNEQRQREQSEFSLLSIPAAWLPPLFAVLVCGLQMTFWGNAVNTGSDSSDLVLFVTDAPGQMLDLLLFAYCIRCLLEYRISMKVSWMARFAFVCGLGAANNWLMVALTPGFLAAVIWIRGLSFFNPRFLGLLALCGLAGLFLILLLPIRTALAHLPGLGLWELLHFILGKDKLAITLFPRDVLLVLSLSSILPIIVIGIRWASYFGDSSQIGILLATITFHVVNAVFLFACLWVAFDPPFSPRHKGIGFALLPLYYLGALSIGYFAGYFLLVFGALPAKARRNPNPLVQMTNIVIIASIWFLAVAVPTLLVWKNLPQLLSQQEADEASARLTSLTAKALPTRPAVVLGDDRLRLLLLENSLSHDAGAPKHLFIDTGRIAQDMSYMRNLEKTYPEFKLMGPSTNAAVSPLALVHMLERLSQQHEIYYIHPSFGYYFERFYMQPHGLVYELKTYPSNQWKGPLPTPETIEENEEYWKKMTETELPLVAHLIEQPNRPVPSTLLRHFMAATHLTVEPNPQAVKLGSWYARSLDYWGAELERAGLLSEAGKRFEEALQVNPDNAAAQINSNFNKNLRAGKNIVVEEPKAILDKVGKHRDWPDLLNEDGPFDDPSHCWIMGVTFADRANMYYLQALQQFDRVRTLAPNFPEAGLRLAQLFLAFRLNADALTAAEQVLQRNPENTNALFYTQALYYEGVSSMSLGSYDKALPVFDQLLQRYPGDTNVINLQAVCLMGLSNYDRALAPLNQLLTLNTNNYDALLRRAICYLQLHDYPAAKADYKLLAQVVPRVYQIDYGLQEVAFHEKDTNAVIKYCQLYLTNYYQLLTNSYQSLPTNYAEPDEVKLIKQRLKESQPNAP